MASARVANNMTLFWIILLNSAISLISLIGVSTFLIKYLRKSQFSGFVISFSAGVLLSSAFLNMLTEAVDESNGSILIYALFGMVIGFLMERSMLWYHHHHSETHNIKPTASIVLLGDAIHNFIDGLAIAATAVISPQSAIVMTIGIAAHEIPQEFADFMILVHSGMKRKTALFYNFISALTAIFGGIAGYFFINRFHYLLPVALALTGGTFIYIAAADLIPSLHENYHKNKSRNQTFAFLLGIFLIYFLSVIVPKH